MHSDCMPATQCLTVAAPSAAQAAQAAMPQRMESKGSTDLDTLQVSVLMSFVRKSAETAGSSHGKYGVTAETETQRLGVFMTWLELNAGAAAAQQPAVRVARLQHARSRGRTAPAIRRPDLCQPWRLQRSHRRHSGSISSAAGDARSANVLLIDPPRDMLAPQ